jgi:hypothetical protein
MPPESTEAPPTFVLSPRALRFRIVVGDETGYAVTRFVGLGGAVLKASVVPPVGATVRLIERYGVRGADVHIDAEVIAAIPEPDLSGREPGFCATFSRITMRGDSRQLLDFIELLEPGYGRRSGGRDRIEPCDDAIRGQCTAFTPRAPWATDPLLEAAGLAAPAEVDWDDGLEHLDLDLGRTPAHTPVAESARGTSTPAPPTPSAPPGTPPPAPPPAPRRRGGLGGLLGGLFGRTRSDDPDT